MATFRGWGTDFYRIHNSLHCLLPSLTLQCLSRPRSLLTTPQTRMRHSLIRRVSTCSWLRWCLCPIGSHMNCPYQAKMASVPWTRKSREKSHSADWRSWAIGSDKGLSRGEWVVPSGAGHAPLPIHAASDHHNILAQLSKNVLVLGKGGKPETDKSNDKSRRFSRDRPRFTDMLDVIKFLCKDLWTLLFRKQIDNLKTNHRVCFDSFLFLRPSRVSGLERCLCTALGGLRAHRQRIQAIFPHEYGVAIRSSVSSSAGMRDP